MSKKEKFSLKDQLFNRPKIVKLSKEIKQAYPKFEDIKFVSSVLKDFSNLELKQRIERISDKLNEFLPNDYLKALAIILKALPAACDPKKSDNDFGDFIYEPFNLFIAKNGCNKKYLKQSLKALEQTTQRFSAEFALRYFIKEFEKETLQIVKSWSKHKHYHVRRLASEGIRPSLPWGGKINLNAKKIIAVLNCLYFDKTRYVTRSVANNLNDISKTDPMLVISTLARWRNEGKQNKKELDYIEKHALRTLLKGGNKEALAFLGYGHKTTWNIKKISLPKKVKIGEKIIFETEIELLKSGNYLIDYVFHYLISNDSHNKKVFKAKNITIKKREIVSIKKSLDTKQMTTRKTLPGIHKIELQINGVKSKAVEFYLV